MSTDTGTAAPVSAVRASRTPWDARIELLVAADSMES